MSAGRGQRFNDNSQPCLNLQHDRILAKHLLLTVRISFHFDIPGRGQTQGRAAEI